MSFKFVCISSIIWTMLARLAVWTSSSACYGLCSEFWGHYFNLCSICKEFQNCSTFVRICSCSVRHLFHITIVIKLVYFFLSTLLYGWSWIIYSNIFLYIQLLHMFRSFEALLIAWSSGLWPSLQERENSTIKLFNAQ